MINCYTCANRRYAIGRSISEDSKRNCKSLVCNVLRTLTPLIFVAGTSDESVSKICEDAIPADLAQSIIIRYKMCSHLSP